VATSDASGNFTIQQSGAGRRTVVLSAPGSVERRTGISLPGSHSRISLIPAAFDLVAFDQMARPSGLSRWVRPPALVVITSVLAFTSVNDPDFTATSETLSDAEVSALLDHLNQGLEPMTGGVFTSFASISTEPVTPGARVGVQRTNTIVVGRYAGLLATAGFQGVTRWALAGGNTVQAAIVFLDRDYEKSRNAMLGALRIHELGHALGYSHVTARPSVMNPIATTEPNDWDRQAASIAFQRPPGNRSPDNDPDAFSTNAAATGAGHGLVWSDAVP
jgi:hypothetical protein